jgi:hypothetical protein
LRLPFASSDVSMSDDDLEAGWEHVLAHWEDPTVHAAFVEACRAELKLAFAAKRYREIATPSAAAYRNDTQRVEVAQQRLKSITALAMADIQLARSDPAMTQKNARMVALALFTLLAVGLTVLLRAFH